MPAGTQRSRPAAKAASPKVAATTPAPLSISIPGLMTAGTDRGFRDLIYELIQLANLMRGNQERFARYIGLSLPQYLMLGVIADGHGRTVGEIAERLEVSSPFVTAEVNKLLHLGLVAKVPNEADRRSAILGLTEAGQARMRDLGPLRRMVNDRMFQSMTPDDAQQMRRIVRALLDHGRSVQHDLDAPHRRDERAPSLSEPVPAAAPARKSRGKA